MPPGQDHCYSCSVMFTMLGCNEILELPNVKGPYNVGKQWNWLNAMNFSAIYLLLTEETTWYQNICFWSWGIIPNESWFRGYIQCNYNLGNCNTQEGNRKAVKLSVAITEVGFMPEGDRGIIDVQCRCNNRGRTLLRIIRLGICLISGSSDWEWRQNKCSYKLCNCYTITCNCKWKIILNRF